MVSNVTLNGVDVAQDFVKYNATSKALVVRGLNGLTSGGAWKAEWVLRWN